MRSMTKKQLKKYPLLFSSADIEYILYISHFILKREMPCLWPWVHSLRTACPNTP